MRVKMNLAESGLMPAITRMWEASGEKLRRTGRRYDVGEGSPVFTVRGRYRARGWTEWTLGFYIGSFMLQFDATGEEEMLRFARRMVDEHLDAHVTAAGVHDHGFMQVSTWGALRRLMKEGRIAADEGEMRVCELALKCSGATQARRWTPLPGGGYIYSFNGPHSLFVDTLRSLRALGLAHRLGGVLLGENDRHVSLLERLVQHAQTTATYAVYYGKGRDAYDVRGRVAHESIFNVNDGAYRCRIRNRGIRRLRRGRGGWRGRCWVLRSNWSFWRHAGRKSCARWAERMRSRTG